MTMFPAIMRHKTNGRVIVAVRQRQDKPVYMVGSQIYCPRNTQPTDKCICLDFSMSGYEVLYENNGK